LPDTVFQSREGKGSPLSRMACLISWADKSGLNIQARDTSQATWGEAIEVQFLNP